MTQHGFSLMEVLASMALVAVIIFFVLQIQTQYSQLMIKIRDQERISSHQNLTYERGLAKEFFLKDVD